MDKAQQNFADKVHSHEALLASPIKFTHVYATVPVVHL